MSGTKTKDLLKIVDPHVEQEPLPDPDQLIFSFDRHLPLNFRFPSEEFDHS